MPELLLALDCGTTTLKACLFSPEGELLAKAVVPIRSHTPAPGRVEQDARRIWRAAQRAMHRALSEAGRTAADLAAIGVTSQRASLVCWDRATGRALSPLVVWSDLRGVERARDLQAEGFPIVAQHAAAKLEGVTQGVADGPALVRAGRLAWGNIDSFLIWKMTGGVHVTDRSHAWPLGYLDLHTFGWNERLIAHQGLDLSSFPTLVDTWGPIGLTTIESLGAAVPVAAVVADQQSALIGQGCEAAGQAKVTYGTSATLDVSTGGAFLYRGAAIPPFVLSSVGGDTRFCLEAMVYTAGAALDWVRASFGLGDHARFERLAATAPDAGGVAFLPALQGLGAPHADAERRGSLSGLSLATGRGQLARAAVEGVAFRIAEAFEHLYAAADLTPPEVLRADGGLTASAVLMPAQADLLGRPVARHATGEATAAGAAICAGRGIGLFAGHPPAAFSRSDRLFEARLSEDERLRRAAVWRGQVYPERA